MFQFFNSLNPSHGEIPFLRRRFCAELRVNASMGRKGLYKSWKRRGPAQWPTQSRPSTRDGKRAQLAVNSLFSKRGLLNGAWRLRPDLPYPFLRAKSGDEHQQRRLVGGVAVGASSRFPGKTITCEAGWMSRRNWLGAVKALAIMIFGRTWFCVVLPKCPAHLCSIQISGLLASWPWPSTTDFTRTSAVTAYVKIKAATTQRTDLDERRLTEEMVVSLY